MHAGDWMFATAVTIICALLGYIWGGRNRVTASDVQRIVTDALELKIQPLDKRVCDLEALNEERKDHPIRHPLANLFTGPIMWLGTRLDLLAARMKAQDRQDEPALPRPNWID